MRDLNKVVKNYSIDVGVVRFYDMEMMLGVPAWHWYFAHGTKSFITEMKKLEKGFKLWRKPS